MQFSKVKGVKIQFPKQNIGLPRVMQPLAEFLADFAEIRTRTSRRGRACASLFILVGACHPRASEARDTELVAC